jgi:peroxiredoxin
MLLRTEHRNHFLQRAWKTAAAPAASKPTGFQKTGAVMLGFSRYNYDHFTREHLHESGSAVFSGPAPGQEAPDFKVRTLDGETLHLSDFAGHKNVLLLFGSATCPMTAGSLPGINELYNQFRGDDIEFLFVYVREAHPGERVPAHSSMANKVRAARLLRDEEDLQMPVLLDDLSGSIHRKYSRMPNPAFLIDKSGRVAFRSMWAQPQPLGAAIEELLRAQKERRTEHAIVRQGEDLSLPLSYGVLYSYRALERGGKQSLEDFRHALGLRGRIAIATSHAARPLLGHPGRALALGALTAVVLAGGMYAGFELRKRRLSSLRNPYRAYEKDSVRDTDTGTDYGAVGI